MQEGLKPFHRITVSTANYCMYHHQMFQSRQLELPFYKKKLAIQYHNQYQFI